MSDALELIFVMAVAFIVFVTIVIAPIDYSHYRSCNNFQEITGMRTMFKHFDQCYVQYNDRWLTMNQYNDILERQLKVTIKE